MSPLQPQAVDQQGGEQQPEQAEHRAPAPLGPPLAQEVPRQLGQHRLVQRRGQLNDSGQEGVIPVRLTDREQDIMLLFAMRAGETIPRHELVGNDSDVGERTIDVQINRLRRKIEDDPANPVWLQTVRGIGYRLSID